MKRTGIAELPLHYGKAPAWLFQRMSKLAAQISYIIVKEKGSDYFLERLSSPLWFQSFGCVLGFDWHSSGLTTTVCGALKLGLRPMQRELGLFICGGKGGASRKTPDQIREYGLKNSFHFDCEKLVYASRMSAKVDNSAVQDGYNLYQHFFIFTHTGNWAVIQQGMNEYTRLARRYHWLGSHVEDFVCQPHTAICSDYKSETLNMVAKESTQTRDICVDLAVSASDKVIRDFEKITTFKLPARHSIYLSDIKKENLRKILIQTYQAQPKNFEALLALKGVGAKTIRALALISELIYGAKPSYEDPAKFSFAHGGKDGHPYPIITKDYDASIEFLRKAISESKIGIYDKMKMLNRLNILGWRI